MTVADVLTSPSASGLAQGSMRTGRSAHRAAAERREVRGRPRPHSGLVQGSMRTGRSAHRAAAERREVRGRPRPHSGLVQGSMRTGRSAHRAAAERREVRGRPRPHPASRKVQCGPGGPRTAPPPNAGRCADVLVRIPALAQDSMQATRPAYHDDLPVRRAGAEVAGARRKAPLLGRPCGCELGELPAEGD